MSATPLVPSRFVNAVEARARFGERVDKLAPFLMKSDPLADAVIAALDELPAGRGWAMVTQAGAEGIAKVQGAPAALREFFDFAEDVPVWVDQATANLGGGVLLRAGPLGGLVLGVRSLVLGYASPGGNKPLVFTGRLEEQAARRLNETARFVQATCKPGGLARFGDGYQITLRVRLIHAQVRHMILKTSRWRTSDWGLPINQHDMVGTSLLFSIVLLQGLRQLGMQVSRDEGEAYMHLWRYSGHLIGVAPELAPSSEQDAQRIGDVIAATQGAPDEDARSLTRALLEGNLNAATTPRARKMELRRLNFASALCRELIGAELADALGVTATSWTMLVPVVRRFVAGAEFVRGKASPLDRRALAVGTRYWDRVVEVGLAGATAQFGLPNRLARAA